MARTLRGLFRALVPLSFPMACTLAQLSCTCDADLAPPLALVPCVAQDKECPAAPPLDLASKTITPGTLAGSFSVLGSGDAAYGMPLLPVPGGHLEPDLALVYNSSAGDGFLGVGFSLAGVPVIRRCPSNVAQDGEVRGVRFDAGDKLCLDDRRLVPVGEAPGVIEYRTVPDTFVKVIGHYPAGATDKTPDNAISFEAHLPSGLVVEYGTGDRGKPLALGGVPRAFLATKMRDGRGQAMTYSYCFADGGGYTAEYALTEIRYTSVEGSTSLEPSRAVRFVYATKEEADVRIRYEHGMALQSSLRLDEVQMVGPSDALVRRYVLAYDESPSTGRKRLISVEECGGDGACKPPTRFQYKNNAPSFNRITTSIEAPTSTLASPMLFDMDGDGLDELIVPDINPALSTPGNPVIDWLVAKNHGPSASPPYFAKEVLALSQEGILVADPLGPADAGLIQPELGSSIDYNQDGRGDVLLHDRASSQGWRVQWDRGPPRQYPEAS